MSTSCALPLVPEAEKGPGPSRVLPQTQRHRQREFELCIRKKSDSNILTSTLAHYLKAAGNTQKVDLNPISIQAEQ